MSWTFLDGTKYNTSSNVSMTFDGSHVWVAGGTSVRVYGFLGDNDNTSQTISLSSYISDTAFMLKVYNEMYIFNDAVSEFIRVNITSKAIIDETVNIIQATDCIPAYGNGKIWFATAESNNVQKLFFYDLSDRTWSTPVTIPGKHQSTKRKILWGRDAYIYVVNVNESGVSKFNADTGAHIIQVISNRTAASGSHITTNDNFEILVSGFNGMVSSINQSTNAVTNISGLGAETQNFIDDGTYLWTVQPSAARITKSTSTDNYLVMKEVPSVSNEAHSSVYETFGFALNNENITSLSLVKEDANTLIEDIDYTFEVDNAFAEQRLTILKDAPNVTGTEPLNITVNYSYSPELKDFEITGFTGTTFIQVLNTPEYTHEYWDVDTLTVQTKTEPQRIVLLASNAIYFAYNLTDSWALEDLRAYELTIKGTALVGTGTNAYHGETQ